MKLFNIFLVLISLFFSQVLCLPYDMDAYNYLDALALVAGTDKASFHHNYTEFYSQYFSPMRNEPIKFLEIGIYQGQSVKLWEEYFPNAELHFIDIKLDQVRYPPTRAQFHIVDQENALDLENFISRVGGGFDIILDDGGHTMSQQITSFCTLFPYLREGGMYIIEDLHTSYWSNYIGNSFCTTINFLKLLIDEVNFVGNHSCRASHLSIPEPTRKLLNLYREKIYSIHFYDGVAIIIKRLQTQ